MTTKEVLVKARGLIEQGWIQGQDARNQNDIPVEPTDPDACQFCTVGALWAVSYQEKDLYYNACRVLESMVSENYLSAFNDNPAITQSHVLDLFDEAIARCKDDE